MHSDLLEPITLTFQSLSDEEDLDGGEDGHISPPHKNPFIEEPDTDPKKKGTGGDEEDDLEDPYGKDGDGLDEDDLDEDLGTGEGGDADFDS